VWSNVLDRTFQSGTEFRISPVIALPCTFSPNLKDVIGEGTDAT
jgi:hypothetical protein